MAAMFAGASRALLASVVFAFETTRSRSGCCRCSAAARRRTSSRAADAQHDHDREDRAPRRARARRVSADLLTQILVRDFVRRVVTLSDHTAGAVLAWLDSDDPDATHQGFPVVNATGTLVGVLTRRDFQRCAGRSALARPLDSSSAAVCL